MEDNETIDSMRLLIRAIKLAKHTDKVFSSREVLEQFRFWQKKLALNSIDSIGGRGSDLKYSDEH